MTRIRSPSLWAAALALTGGAAALAPAAIQLVVAAAILAILGLPHGAADLARIDRAARAGFLSAYGAAVVATVMLWRVAPGVALAGFLILSAVHFAADGEEKLSIPGRWAEASLLITAPALFHPEMVRTLFDALVAPDFARTTVTVMGIVATLAALVWIAENARGPVEPDRLIAIAALAILPPLLGFAIGFVLLHAAGETWKRQRELGCADLPQYLVLVTPVLVGAAVLIGMLGLIDWKGPGLDIRWLFAALSALAVPHMLVTPLWLSPARQGRERTTNSAH